MTPVISGVVKQQLKCECLAFNYKIATFAKQQREKKSRWVEPVAVAESNLENNDEMNYLSLTTVIT